MKKHISLVVLLAAIVGWIGMIVSLSSQTGDESGGLSAIISEPVTKLLASVMGGLSGEEEAALYLNVDGTIRGLAHFSEFAVLGAMLARLAVRTGLKGYWMPWLAGALVAIADEWRQSFSPGRVSDPVDVLIDVLGVICGSLLLNHLLTYWRKKHVYHS